MLGWPWRLDSILGCLATGAIMNSKTMKESNSKNKYVLMKMEYKN
jgi:hypothetical protein